MLLLMLMGCSLLVTIVIVGGDNAVMAVGDGGDDLLLV
jgi:hypothetical protein